MNTLRPNQIRAITESIDNDFTSGIHYHATGTGKSWIAMNIILEFYKKYPKYNVIWICEKKSILIEQFNIKNLGRDPKTFSIDNFWKYEKSIAKKQAETNGSTFPFLIHKKDYLKIGGFDESYPGPWVVDWEFFMKCEMANLNMIRTYNTYFYHFVSLGTKSLEQVEEARIKEQACHEYFYYKWGKQAQHNPINNSKLIF